MKEFKFNISVNIIKGVAIEAESEEQARQIIEDALEHNNVTELISPEVMFDALMAADITLKDDGGCYDSDTLIPYVRRCSHCGAPMSDGFYLGGEHACSEECLKALYGGGPDAWEKYLADHKDGDGDCFYTEWDGYLTDDCY